MSYIYHLVTPSNWQAYSQLPYYEAPSLHTEGFIHCSTNSQMEGVLERYFSHETNVMCLVLDEAQVADALKYEEATNQELFPHIYGVIPKNAIVEVRQVKFG